MFYKYLPFLQWINELKDKNILRKDIFAGLSVSFILIPQSMAYAQLAGLPVEVGLYTAFIPVIVAALFGSSPQMSTWPVTIVSLMTATALAPIASSWSEGYIAYASFIAFFTSLFYLLIGSLRLWVIVDFLSHPVIVGFTNAAAILTISSQLSKIFWVSYEKSWTYVHWLINLFWEILSSTHLPTLICGVSSILFLIIIWRIFPKTPKVLFLIILSITFSYYLWYNANFWGSIIKNIPSELPGFSLNFLSVWMATLWFYDIFRLWLFSIIIGLIGFTESISVAKFVSYTTKKPLSPNRELIWQWLANLSSSLFWWYWVAGSFSKTAVNLKAGASTGLTGVITGLMVGFTLLFLTPFLEYLPTATLAAIIIVAVTHMIRFKPLNQAWKIEKHDAIIGYITFLSTLAFSPNIEVWVLVWVVLSLVFFIYRSMRPKIIELWLYKDGTYRDIDLFWLKSSKDIWVYRLDGNLFFANSWYIESKIFNHILEEKELSYIILDFEWVNNIDSSAAEMLNNLVTRMKEENIKVYVTWIRAKVFQKLTVSKFIKNFWEKRVLLSISDAISKIKKKSNKKTDFSSLLGYEKDKKKSPELEKKVIKKIEKISD